MAAANFSRDVLEHNRTITNDLIDFETIIETPQQEEKKSATIFKVVLRPKKQFSYFSGFQKYVK